MAKKIIKRKLKDHEFLTLYKQGLCLKCFKRPRTKSEVCDSCHILLQQVAQAAIPVPCSRLTVDELQEMWDVLEEKWPD